MHYFNRMAQERMSNGSMGVPYYFNRQNIRQLQELHYDNVGLLVEINLDKPIFIH